jgi:hypothetical protein
MKNTNSYWELVRKYREFPEDEEVIEEVLGLYCSKEAAMNEREDYRKTEVDKEEVEHWLLPKTVSLRIRKLKDIIEEPDPISFEELSNLDYLADLSGEARPW